jgi:hypothetical protein
MRLLERAKEDICFAATDQELMILLCWEFGGE